MDLHLNLKAEYFNDIKAGKKPFEYRLKNDYWTKRLVGRGCNFVHFKSGYPKHDAWDKVHSVPYRGYEVQIIVHPHFGKKPVEVFAIFTDDSLIKF